VTTAPPKSNDSLHLSLSRASEHGFHRQSAGILARAFVRDPVLRYSQPKAKVRSQIIGPLYETASRIAAAIGGVEILPGRACALWLEGRMDAPFLLGLRCGYWRLFWMAGPRAFLRLLRHENYCAARARKLGPKYYGYLWVLGVHPASQRRGWGASVLHCALRALRKRGHSTCLLKTESEENVLFYEKLGFSCIETMVVPPSGIRYWLLQKELSDELLEAAKSRT
jgi:GNAT superfamily N-acetyltransferase